MPNRDAMRILPLALVGAVLVQAGCGSDTEPGTKRATRAPEVRAADAGELSTLAKSLARDYRVEVVPARRLPRKELLVPPPKKDNVPALIKPVAGLGVDLPGAREGFVYRYASHEIALAAAPSFLEGLSGGVSGCGAQIWFTGSAKSSARPVRESSTRAASAEADWQGSVGTAIKRTDAACRKQQFQVVA